MQSKSLFFFSDADALPISLTEAFTEVPLVAGFESVPFAMSLLTGGIMWINDVIGFTQHQPYRVFYCALYLVPLESDDVVMKLCLHTQNKHKKKHVYRCLCWDHFDDKPVGAIGIKSVETSLEKSILTVSFDQYSY